MARHRFPSDFSGIVFTSRPGDLRPLLLRDGIALTIYRTEQHARAGGELGKADITGLDGKALAGSVVLVRGGLVQPFLGPADGTDTLWTRPAGGEVQSLQALVPPLSRVIRYEHQQTSPSASWQIPHDLGRTPHVTVLLQGPGGLQEVDADVEHPTPDLTTVVLSTAAAGRAVLTA